MPRLSLAVEVLLRRGAQPVVVLFHVRRELLGLNVAREHLRTVLAHQIPHAVRKERSVENGEIAGILELLVVRCGPADVGVYILYPWKDLFRFAEGLYAVGFRKLLQEPFCRIDVLAFLPDSESRLFSAEES